MSVEAYPVDQAPVMTPRNDYSTLVGVMREIEDFNRRYGCLDAVLRAQGVLVDDGPQPERVDSTNIADVRARKEALTKSDVLSRVGLEIDPGVSRITINSGNETEIYETLGLRIKDGKSFANLLRTLKKDDIDDRFGDYATSIVFSSLTSYLKRQASDPNNAYNLLHAKAISDELIRLGIDNSITRKLGSLEQPAVSK